MSIIDRLTQGDVTKDEEVFKRGYIDCMYRMMYWDAKDKYIEKVNRAQMEQNKTRR